MGDIFSLESGPPFSVNLGSFDNAGLGTSNAAQRPNTKPGSNYCGSTTLDKPKEWFNPAIFTLPAAGKFGDTPRNAMCGPALYSLDISLMKETKLREHATLVFRGEFFNILNHPNFSVPVNTQGPNGSGGNGTGSSMAIFQVAAQRTPQPDAELSIPTPAAYSAQ